MKRELPNQVLEQQGIIRQERERPTAERAAFLDGACAGDQALRQRLEARLAAHDKRETMLASQADTARPAIKLDLADAPDQAVGQTLGRSKLLERIGEGGCDVVHVAEETEPGRRRVATQLTKLGMDTSAEKQSCLRGGGGRAALPN